MSGKQIIYLNGREVLNNEASLPNEYGVLSYRYENNRLVGKLALHILKYNETKDKEEFICQSYSETTNKVKKHVRITNNGIFYEFYNFSLLL